MLISGASDIPVPTNSVNLTRSRWRFRVLVCLSIPVQIAGKLSLSFGGVIVTIPISFLMTFLGVAVGLMMTVGCDFATKPSQPQKSDLEWVDPNKIQSRPTMHESLLSGFIERIKNIHRVFADVDGTPLEKWIDDFQRDLDPEQNIRIWEDMAVAYEKYLDGRALPLTIRKEVFKVLLFRSMANEDDVLSRIKLEKISLDDAKVIMAGYPSAPKPIEVIQSPR